MIILKIKYNANALQHIITDLAELTGISIAFLDTDFNYIVRAFDDADYCSKLQQLKLLDQPCHCSDLELLTKCKNSGKLESHLCHAGLCDTAMPIIKNQIIVGFVIFGRIRTKESPKVNNFKTEHELLNTLYNKLPFFTVTKISYLTDLLPRILFQNAIEIENDNLVDEISEYIKNNLKEDLSINYLSQKFFISKNKLYRFFCETYGITVNAYITKQRIEKAKELLKTKDPIYKIAEETGIDNYTYFCKLFKRKTGLTPTEYRRGCLSKIQKAFSLPR